MKYKEKDEMDRQQLRMAKTRTYAVLVVLAIQLTTLMVTIFFN